MFKVDASSVGLRLDRFLAHALPKRTSISLLQKLIRVGDVRVDERRVRDSALRLALGQTISVRVPAPTAAAARAAAVSPKHLELARSMMIHVDADVVALNKPTGWCTQGGVRVRHHIGQLYPALQQLLGDAEAPRLVHRLDRDASGVLVLARSRASAAALGAALLQRRWTKEYVALVAGVPPSASGTIETSIDGQTAASTYRVLDGRVGGHSLLSLSPLTGRKHQLRIHCARDLRTPIVGDSLYGGEAHTRLMLHAERVVLPTTPTPTTVVAKTDEFFVRRM